MTGSAVIRIEAVKVLASEIRAISRGWGAVHWLACVPTFVPLIGLLAVLITIQHFEASGEAQVAVLGVLFVTVMLWAAAQRMMPWIYARAGKQAPTAGVLNDWELSDEGLEITNPLTRGRIDWRAIRAVREEHDRFVFLLTPMNNPVLPKRAMTTEQIAALKTLIADVTTSGRLGRGVD